MGEYKRKFGIYAAWNYELEMEDLNRMSEKGWQLVRGGCFSNKFKKNTEVQYRYQLDYQPIIEEKGRYLETYREQGWEYINSIFNGWHYFRKLYDPEKPEEEYEIFTDYNSRKEMNHRWGLIGCFCSLIHGVILALQAFSMVMQPTIPGLVRIIFWGTLFLTFLRGTILMLHPKKIKNARWDKILITSMFLVMILSGIVHYKLMEERPVYHVQGTWINIKWSEEKEWMSFDVPYEDNFYLDMEINADAPFNISIEDEEGKVYYFTEASGLLKENDAKIRLPKGHYKVLILNFQGEEIEMKVDLE